MAKKKVAPKMKAWLKFGCGCRKSLGMKPFKKGSSAQKRKLAACVMGMARKAGLKV